MGAFFICAKQTKLLGKNSNLAANHKLNKSEAKRSVKIEVLSNAQIFNQATNQYIKVLHTEN